MSPSRRRAMARCAAWHPAPSPRTLARPVTPPSPRPWGFPTLPARAASPHCRAPWCGPVAARIARASLPSPVAVPIARSICHAVSLPCGPVAVGRDVPPAPPRPVVRPHCRAPWCGPVAVGRDVRPPGLPARAAAPRRGARLGIPLPRRAIIARGGFPPLPIAAPPRPAPAYTPIPEQKFRLTEIQKIGSIFTRFYGTLAQLVEHVTFNHRVAGSIPAHPTIC